ncbi:MAG TPA: glycine cleavage system protein GcvH [Pseudonocardiaceae bacterium]|mgnify:CR=1 FL=1
MVPEELRYTEQHEWVSRVSEDTVRVGITDYAQQQLGDVVFVQLPEVGRKVGAGESVAEVESTKSVSDIYAPVSGEVVARNDSVETQPELINSDPYEAGWMFELRVDDPSAVDQLLDAAAYRQQIEQE